MPPSRGSFNPIEGPGDYDTTQIIHNDTYPAIDSAKADLAGKAVFVSGGSKGLGKAACISFAKAGASRIAVSARSDVSKTIQAMKDAVSSMGKPEPKIIPVTIDVTDKDSVARAVAQVEHEFGHLDILINNAGIFSNGKIADSDPDEWFSGFKVNLMGPYLMTRGFLPLMLKGGDKTIVTTASVGAHCTTPGLSGYQTSKLAVLRFTEFIAAEYEDQGVLAYCVHPGNIPTDIVGGPEGLDPSLKHIFVETAELSADSFVYLTSEKREWLNGRYINVTWDLPELMGMKDEIVRDDKLKVRLVV